MNTSFNWETLASVEECMPLLRAHWDEAASYFEVFDPKLDKYREAEANGFLHILVIRDGDAPIGYAWMFVSEMLQCDAKRAQVEGYFIHPDYRAMSIFAKMGALLELRAADLGAQYIEWTRKAAKSGGMWHDHGYQDIEITCMKKLF